jgi:hypothetical protein
MSSKKVQAKALGGSTFVKVKTYFLPFSAKNTGAYRSIMILLYNRIYFNDLCIYVIGVQ